ncbi:response regulator [Halobacteriales archaeon Cl-PHB]
MTDGTKEQATVLVVEDEAELAQLYTDYLRDEYDVRTAVGGEEGLELVDEAVDVVVLDRRMPVVSGDEVVATIAERDLDPRIALVTAVNPDFDIIDMGIDDYLVKPVTRGEMVETIDRLLRLEEYGERVRELTAKQLKRNVLAVEKTKAELDRSEEFRRLTDEIRELKADVDAIADDIDAEQRQRYI